MITLSIKRAQLPVLKLSGFAFIITIVAGSAFVLMRYYRLSAQGESFAYGFEIGRMLFNFGGMALLTPLIYQIVKHSLKFPKAKIIIWFVGLLFFCAAYLIFNNITLYLFFDTGSLVPFKFSKKLFLNFGHLLVLFYGTAAYASYYVVKRRDSSTKGVSPTKESTHIQVKIDGIERKLALEKISHIETYDHYLKLYDIEGRFQLVRMPLKLLLRDLPHEFLQIHRSWVVNTSHVIKTTLKKGAYHLHLKNGAALKVSHSFREAVLKAGLIN